MSNDIASCGCEGHVENQEDCKYPRLQALLSCFLAPRPMTMLWDNGPEAQMRCGCGKIFNVDACMDENLRLVTDGGSHRTLVAQCPGCGLCDRRDWMDP